MASDPSRLLEVLIGTTGQGYNGLRQVQDDDQQQQLGEQRIQANQLQLDGAAQQAARDAAFQTDTAAYFKDPSPMRLAELASKYPDHAGELKNTYSIMQPAQLESRKLVLGQLFNAAKNGRTDLVASNLENVIKAEKAQGLDTSDAEAAMEAARRGDKDALKAVQAFAQMHLAAADSKFAADIGAIDSEDGKNHFSPLGDGRVLDQRTGAVTGEPRPDKGTIERVESVDAEGNTVVNFVRVGAGGQPSSSPSAPVSGRTQGGWTPRERNGGDNSDAAVDNKIKGVAELLGVDPNADVSTLSPLQIAKALAYGEGGKGSLADRNNNPTNIRNGDGSYKKFENPDKAYSAAAALVARKLRKGQTTVKTLIEGLPVGGGSSQPSGTPGALASFVTKPAGAGAANIVAGDLSTVPPSIRAAVKAVAEGRTAPPRAGSRNGEAMLDAVTAYDPTFDAANATSRVKTRVDFTSGKSAQAVNAMNTAMGHLLHLDDQAHDLGNSSFMPGVINPIYNAGRTRIGNNTSLGAFEQTKQAASSELRKVFAGAGGGNLEELKQFEANLDSSKSPEQLHTVIANAVELLGSRLNALEDQYTQGMGRSDQIPTMIKPSLARSAKQRFGIDLGSHGKAEAPASSVPPAGAKQIGTYQGKAVFQLPNGKRVVAQ